LQGLACDLADRAEATGRLTRLRDLQRDLPVSIHTAPNGPYLVTNVATLRDHLGLPVPVTPQLALCRCGGSARKPFCDGSHASNGFTDEKDPKRVPDRRDSYPGVQVTVLDNRGLCQHSGLCTDRLPAAFRTSQEPFVAASGGRMDEIIRAVRDCPSGALGLAIDGREQHAVRDWADTREPAIEVTQDGPYRVTGGIELSAAGDGEVARNHGASREHYALCRCGHSQNKPFCSGMHWYVDFRDPARPADRTLFEWAGGLPALTRMTRLLYERMVPADALLAAAFADMPPGHPEQETAALAEALGGPPWTPPADAYPRLLGRGAARDLAEDQRARWVTLAGQAARDAGLPADPQFQAALTGYLEWSSRNAVAHPAGPPAAPDQPAAAWDWTPAGQPPAEPSEGAAAGQDTQAQPVPRPGPDDPVSFAAHIKPLFRARDQKSMSFAFDLWSADDVQAHAADILDRLRNGSMPCDGAWTSEQIAVFQRWTETGFQP
jgi:CDGSH-type Zn-finger protein/truncated hemoglobin YjbI